MVRAGDVFRWRDFPFPRDPHGEIKARWFLCLGTSSRLLVPVFVYLCTATTVGRYYAPGGERVHNQYIRVRKGEHGFPEDCILDVDANLYDELTEEALAKAAARIEPAKRAPDDFLRRVWKLVRDSRAISRKVKADIFASLNLVGVTNLKRPG